MGLGFIPKIFGFHGFGFRFHAQIFWVLGMGLGFIPKKWVLGFIPKIFGFHGFGFGFHTQNFWVLGMGLGCGYETQTQNPNPNFFGCECMSETNS